MPDQKLTIVPVTLQVENQEVPSSVSPISPICTLKISKAEISFFPGIDERTVQTIMRELKNL